MKLTELEKSILEKIYFEVADNDRNCYQEDAMRSEFTCGVINGYIDILREMGHFVESGSYIDAGCNHFSYLCMDGHILVHSDKDIVKFTNEFFEIAC